MPTRSKAGQLLRAGVVLLALALAGSFLTQALLGQQQSAALANLPAALLNVVAFIFSTAHILGAALVAVALGIHAMSPTPLSRARP